MKILFECTAEEIRDLLFHHEAGQKKDEQLREAVRNLLYAKSPEPEEPAQVPANVKPTNEPQKRQTVDIDEEELWHLYSSGQASVKELSMRYGCSQATIHNRLTKIQKEVR